MNISCQCQGVSCQRNSYEFDLRTIIHKLCTGHMSNIVSYGVACNELVWQTLPIAPVDEENRRLTTSFKTALCLTSSANRPGRRIWTPRAGLALPQVFLPNATMKHRWLIVKITWLQFSYWNYDRNACVPDILIGNHQFG
jgi:hypothetical protein